MIERGLYNIAFSEEWGRQMRFITGPRQSGKTTIAGLKLKNEGTENLYYLWDLRKVRKRYKENELFFTVDGSGSTFKQWVCFDEIHKMPKWKNMLKGMYDETFDRYNFIITGSAKLNISRHAGDSLSGRFFVFHLFPLCLAELTGIKTLASEPKKAEEWLKEKLESQKASGAGALAGLLEYSGYPEPFIRQSKRFHTKWAEDYLDTVIKEDIGALTRIIDREYLYDLYRLLPEMVGNPISESSIASHLEVSPPTVKNYLKRLEDFYLAFRIYPYSKNIKRSLLRASKCYLYDWTRVKDPARRFENYVAADLNARLHLWTDMTGERYSLFYVRDKDRRETDFLITKGEKPWLLIEAKYSDSPIAGHHLNTQAMLGNIPLLQICNEENIRLLQKKNVYRISASSFLN